MLTTLLYASSVQETLDLSIPHENIGTSVSLFEDTSGIMSLARVKEAFPDKFTPQKKSVDAHLFTTSAFWYRFEVNNKETHPVTRLIVLGIPWLDRILINVINVDKTESHSITGDIFPYKQRTLDNSLPNREYIFQPGISTVYVQVKTRDPFIVPISVMDSFTFLKESVHQGNHTAFLYGIIVAMLLYNLFLFLSIRAPYYGFYVLYLSLFLVANASYNCYTFVWLFYNYPTVQNWAESTTIFLYLMGGLMFAQSFLNLKNHFPVLNRFTNSLILLYITLMFLSSLMGYHYQIMFAISLTVFFSLYVFCMAFYAFFKGYRYALFFLLGSSAGLLGAAITALTVMSFIPYSDIGYRAVDYGMAIDAILLSLALAERVKITQDEKLAAQKEAKTDVMTGLLNRRAYNEIALIELNRHNRYGGNLTVVMVDIDYFKTVNDTYGHAAGDKVLRELADILKNILRENDYAFRFGGEEFLLLLPETGTNEAVNLAERIRIEVENMRVTFLEYIITTTISCGVSGVKPDDISLEEAEKRADDALYLAKNRGRNQVAITT
jgi:diguanylate cyclase (GGDEF)-like protein